MVKSHPTALKWVIRSSAVWTHSQSTRGNEPSGSWPQAVLLNGGLNSSPQINSQRYCSLLHSHREGHFSWQERWHEAHSS